MARNQPHGQAQTAAGFISNTAHICRNLEERRGGKNAEERSFARSSKSVERLMLFLAEDVSLFQGNLVIFLCFSEMEFKVNSLANAARHMQLKFLPLILSHSKSSLSFQTTIKSDNSF